ncbi:MAG TPA: TolC family protein [Firmicutes bacterium]|nr:TolC family protein [Bacillota bacterium]
MEYASLASIQNRVLNHNRDLTAAMLDVEIAKLNLRMAKADQLRHADPVAVKFAEMEVAVAMQAVETLKHELLLQAEEAYYLLIKNEQQTQLAVQTKDYIQTQLELTAAQYEEGLATQQDLDRMLLAATEIDHQLQKLEKEKELARMKLLRLMDLSYDHSFAIAEYDFEFAELDLEADLMELLVENNPELRFLASELELAYLQHKLSHPDYTPDIICELNRLKYEKKSLIYRTRIDQLYLQALELQHQIEELEAKYRELLQQADLAKAYLETVTLRHQEGLELPLAVMEAEIEQNRTKTELISSLFAYNVAKARFANLIGLGLEGES